MVKDMKTQEEELALAKKTFEDDMKTIAAAKDELSKKEESMAKLETRLSQLRSLLNT
jgi:hypothetical protein